MDSVSCAHGVPWAGGYLELELYVPTPPPLPPHSLPPQPAGSPPPATTAGTAVTILIAHHQCPRRRHACFRASKATARSRAMDPAAPQQHEGRAARTLQTAGGGGWARGTRDRRGGG
eukprot:gene16434-biopygen18795